MRSWALVIALVAACATGKEDGAGSGGNTDAAQAGVDAPAGGNVDAPVSGSADAPVGGSVDAPVGGNADAPVAVDASGAGLDPDLELPDPGGAVCTGVGYEDTCGSGKVCRFYDSSEGRCESCGPCGNLNASCSWSDECDILFMCYQGRCTNFCTLGTTECGAPTDCLDIGHPTRGVCRPF